MVSIWLRFMVVLGVDWAAKYQLCAWGAQRNIEGESVPLEAKTNPRSETVLERSASDGSRKPPTNQAK